MSDINISQIKDNNETTEVIDDIVESVEIVAEAVADDNEFLENIVEATENDDNAESGNVGPQNSIQRFYEHFRGVPLKYIDIFIGVCFVGLFAVVILGILKGRGII